MAATTSRNLPVMLCFSGFWFKMTLYYVIALILLPGIANAIQKPRGVAISQASFYQPGETFTCRDGSATIPFSHVNDDYCDCSDASDEPGTSACPTGTFHCTNAGHRPMNIPAAWVNDGICDCCDGTDEFEMLNPCENNCKEMGREAREEAERQRVLLEEGHEIFKDYSKQGQEARKDKLERRELLEQEKTELQNQRDELEILKEDAEKPESEAKEQHKQAWEELKKLRDAQKEVDSFTNAFLDLDTNEDNMVSVTEIQQHPEFDIDSNGEVSLEEAKEYLEDQENVDMDVFRDKIWPNIKEIYKSKDTGAATEQASPPPPTDSPPVNTEEEVPPEEYEEDIEEYEDEEDEVAYEADTDDAGSSDEDQMPPYDEETQKLIDAADKAREEFDEVDKRFRDVEREINDISKFMDMDMGESNEFYPLKGNCYELTDSQYVYKLCPFDKASQRGKHGGSETSLGVWGRWDGGNKRYSVMKFEKGQNCWNGPDRSVRVKLQCGSSNELLSASEPNRCEYEFKFSTPALCSHVPSPDKNVDEHDEL